MPASFERPDGSVPLDASRPADRAALRDEVAHANAAPDLDAPRDSAASPGVSDLPDSSDLPDDPGLPDISGLRGRDRRRAATVLAVFSLDGEPLSGGIDMTLLDEAGAPVGHSVLGFVEPHAPALSEVMSDVEDHLLGAAHLVVDPGSYALVQRGRALRARVSPAPRPGALDT